VSKDQTELPDLPANDTRDDDHPDGPIEVSFKPALLRAKVTWRLEGDILTHGRQQVDLSQVQAVSLVDSRIQGMVIRSLILTTPAGKTRIQVSSTTRHSADMRGVLPLFDAVLARLAHHAPDMDIRLADTGGTRIAMFVIGLLTLIAGLGFTIAVMAGSGRGNGDVMVYCGAMVLLGLFFTLQYAPWRKVQTLPIALHATLITAMGG
jgi:hypothetical protein